MSGVVRVVRVAATREVRALVECVFTEPSTLAALPECQRTPEWREEFFQRIYEGEVPAYVPFLFGNGSDVPTPQGLYWGDVCGAGAAFGHQVLMEGARQGLNAVKCGKACWQAFLRDYPGVSLVFGLTPEDNRAAVAVARRCGLRDVGPVVSGGVACRLMVAERAVFFKE